ncbi:MAG: efflux transporter periplasmic adaptor subunit [Caulobacteraceae bacterium]|jgi:RND family efflux transporter MFP subunit|nr:efflux transporter periplasmic adaptor subunit [Caulobacteraceae bacterium]
MTSVIRRPAFAGACAAIGVAACSPHPTPPADPSVLVTTQPAKRGTLPVTVDAYGAVGPAANALRSISLQQLAQVVNVAVTPGVAVRKGQPLLLYSSAPESRAAFGQAQTAVALAKAVQAHAADNFSRQLATRDDVSRADAALQSAQDALAALQRQGASEPGGVLAAPFDGVVVTMSAAAGDRVQPGAVLMSIAPANGLVVTAGVEPDVARRVHIGDAAQVQSITGGPTLPSRVLRVDSALNARSRLVDIDVAAPGVLPMPGSAFRVTLSVGDVQGWTVPHAAVLNDEKGDYLFQLAKAKAVRVPVQVRSPSSVLDVVDGPLDASRPVIVDGAFQLTDGMAARTQPNP